MLPSTSFLAGAGFAAVALVAMAQMPLTPTPIPSLNAFVHPRDFVQIQEGVPYTVPLNKLLTVTAMGGIATNMGFGYLNVNGSLAMMVEMQSSTLPTSMAEVPRGLTIPANSVVTVTDGLPGSDARVWGYLSDP